MSFIFHSLKIGISDFVILLLVPVSSLLKLPWHDGLAHSLVKQIDAAIDELFLGLSS